MKKAFQSLTVVFIVLILLSFSGCKHSQDNESPDPYAPIIVDGYALCPTGRRPIEKIEDTCSWHTSFISECDYETDTVRVKIGNYLRTVDTEASTTAVFEATVIESYIGDISGDIEIKFHSLYPLYGDEMILAIYKESDGTCYYPSGSIYEIFRKGEESYVFLRTRDLDFYIQYILTYLPIENEADTLGADIIKSINEKEAYLEEKIGHLYTMSSNPEICEVYEMSDFVSIIDYFRALSPSWVDDNRPDAKPSPSKPCGNAVIYTEPLTVDEYIVLPPHRFPQFARSWYNEHENDSFEKAIKEADNIVKIKIGNYLEERWADRRDVRGYSIFNATVTETYKGELEGDIKIAWSSHILACRKGTVLPLYGDEFIVFLYKDGGHYSIYNERYYFEAVTLGKETYIVSQSMNDNPFFIDFSLLDHSIEDLTADIGENIANAINEKEEYWEEKTNYAYPMKTVPKINGVFRQSDFEALIRDCVKQ